MITLSAFQIVKEHSDPLLVRCSPFLQIVYLLWGEMVGVTMTNFKSQLLPTENDHLKMVSRRGVEPLLPP